MVVISGKKEACNAVVKALSAAGVKAKELNTSDAFHSPAMEPMLGMFSMLTGMIKFEEPTIPFVSNVTGALADGATVCNGQYWTDHVRAAVNFNAGINSLHATGAQLLMELGPQPVLIGMGKRCFPGVETPPIFVPTLARGKADSLACAQAAAQLTVAGIGMDMGAVVGYGSAPACPTPLPTYAFDKKRFWVHTEREVYSPAYFENGGAGGGGGGGGGVSAALGAHVH